MRAQDSNFRTILDKTSISENRTVSRRRRLDFYSTCCRRWCTSSSIFPDLRSVFYNGPPGERSRSHRSWSKTWNRSRSCRSWGRFAWLRGRSLRTETSYTCRCPNTRILIQRSCQRATTRAWVWYAVSSRTSIKLWDRRPSRTHTSLVWSWRFE
mgnify:CR=1 FL=1